MNAAEAILQYLEKMGAVLMGRHFVYTSGKHGPAYVNMRVVAHCVDWLNEVGEQLGVKLSQYRPDIIIGPETLGRQLAPAAARKIGVKTVVWCKFEGTGDDKIAVFPENMDFASLLKHKRVAIVDDLLTTGSSLRQVVDLVRRHGGIVVAAAVVVRRTPDVVATTCNVPALEVLAEVNGFILYTEDECAKTGPCSRKVPMVLRPGHGHKWILDNPDYPVAA